tara:strand:+ start:348 stop:563 length:216 start_codon:yes stop_codon:yes gene_type:complete
MKYILIYNLLAISIINPIVNAHENHDLQIYNWSDSKNKNVKTDRIFNDQKLENKKNKKTTKNKSWIKIFSR